MESYKGIFVKLPITPGRKWVRNSLLMGSSGEWNNTFYGVHSRAKVGKLKSVSTPGRRMGETWV